MMPELTREQMVEAFSEGSGRWLREVVEELMAQRGIESLEELHRRFVETEYAYIAIPGRHRGKPTTLESFKQHVEARDQRLYPEFYQGLREVLGLTYDDPESHIILGSYCMGPTRSAPKHSDAA
jgi:hypothetical protein